MDTWFPIVVMFCGIFLQLSLQMPNAAKNLERVHPIPGSLQRMDRMSWLFIIVGSLWGLQNLML